MKKQRFCVILVVLGALLFNGCVSWRWDAEIELDSNQRIETLQFYDEYFAQNKKSSASPSYSPIPTTPTTTPAPATTTTTNTTLKYGKYTCSGANYYMNLTGYGNSGTITLNLNSGLHPMLASGSFKIQNNRIIITLSYVDSRYVSWPSGTSFSYNISDDKCFQAGNEVWFYSGY